jgi:hypothetical protein
MNLKYYMILMHLRYTQSHYKLLNIQLSYILEKNVRFRNHRNYDNSKFINKYY